MSTIVRHPKRTTAALASALAAVGVAVGSGADFSSEAANPANTFSAGSLSIDDSRSGAAVFSPSNMRPGAPAQTGTVDIENAGSIDAAFTLSRDRLASSDGGTPNPAPFAAKVNLTVTDCGAFSGAAAAGCGDGDDRVVYSGTLADEDGARPLGSFAAGERHRFQFAAQLDASAGNEYQGDSASARYLWDAVQR